MLGKRLLKKADGTYVMEIQRDSFTTLRREPTPEELKSYLTSQPETLTEVAATPDLASKEQPKAEKGRAARKPVEKPEVKPE